MTAEDRFTQLLGIVLGAICMAAGWALVSWIAWVLVQRRVRRLEESFPGAARPAGFSAGNNPLWYLLSGFFYPFAFAGGLWMLRKPETARIGRACFAIGLGFISAYLLLAIPVLLGFALWAPDLLR